MKAKSWAGLVGIMVSLMVLASVAVAGHGHERPMKTGILLVTFGTSIPEAQIAFENIERQVKETFKETPVRWAYTSSIIRKKLAKEGKQLDSVETALAKMMDEDFTHVAVQSLHTIRGEEYEDLEQTVAAFRTMPEGFKKIVIGAPLLSAHADMEQAAAAVIANIPKDRQKDEAVVLMGHGTPHPSNAFYTALMYHLQSKDPDVFVGTVEGAPDINDIVKLLQDRGIKKACLMPFMSVAGDHARNDMAGDEPDSWKSILTKAGIECRAVLKGTAEYDNMVAIWINHLKDALAHLQH